MFWADISIDEISLAEYTLLKKYASYWKKMDLESLRNILDPKVEFDAPGVPFDLYGIDSVLKAHSLWFESLQIENEMHSSPFDEDEAYSCYEVNTLLYPYDHKFSIPHMQLSFFTKHAFYKVYYFYVKLDESLSKIRRIETRHVKFLVEANSFYENLSRSNKAQSSLPKN
jgi:hypothetical protein